MMSLVRSVQMVQVADGSAAYHPFDLRQSILKIIFTIILLLPVWLKTWTLFI